MVCSEFRKVSFDSFFPKLCFPKTKPFVSDRYVKAQSLMKDSAVPSKRCGRGYLSQREWLLEKAADEHVTKDLLDKAEEQFLLGMNIIVGGSLFHFFVSKVNLLRKVRVLLNWRVLLR